MQRKEEVKFGGAAMSLPADLSCLQGGGGGGGGGGADREAALATLEKQLICPICLELFSKPVVILPCQHNLCRKCANELYQPTLFQARTTMMVSSGRFRCPSCRHEVVLDRHGVYGLQRNLLVENIIDIYKQEVSNKNSSDDDAVSPLPPPLPPAAKLTCPDHEGEKVNIYCLTCRVSTCSLCKVFGAHRSCRVAPLTDIYQQQKDELSEGISSLVEVNGKIQALISELEEACRAIEENCKTQKQSVCDKFGRMVSILQERHKAMTQQISSEQDEKTGHTQALVRRYGDSVEANAKLMERAAGSMEEPDMAAFVQNSRELITKVIAAAGPGSAEMLRPGYEDMSHYTFNFSRQERALRGIDFIKAAEDVPEEPEVEPEPEEPKESSVQNTEPEHHQETSIQNLQSVPGPVKETIPALSSPPAEPEQKEAPASTLVPPAPGLLRDSVEPAGADLQPESDDADLEEGGSGQIKNKEEEEEEEEEEQEDEAEGCAGPDPGKEANICEHQEGMSTQQYEGGGAERDAGDWTAQREMEEKPDAWDEGGEEEEIQVKEGTDVVFYPSQYKPGSRYRVSPGPGTVQTSSTPPAGGSLSEAGTQSEAYDAVRAGSELQAQPQPLWAQDSQLLSGTQTWIREQGTPYPNWTPTGSGEAGIIQEENEEEEEEGLQGWVCLPGTVDKGFSQADTSFDLGDRGLDNVSDNNDTTLSLPVEDTSSGTDDDDTKFMDGKEEDAEEKGQLEEDVLGLNGASGLKGEGLGGGKIKAEMMERGSRVLRQDSSRSEMGGEAARGGSSEDVEDPGVESKACVIRGIRDAEFEAGSSMSAGHEQEVGVSGERPEDFRAQRDAGASETEEKITPCVSLQAVTLLFYLLAFLLILQRVWAYIGCFVCT